VAVASDTTAPAGVRAMPGAAVGGVASMVHVREAGEALTLPAASTTRTANACCPSGSDGSVRGLVHDAHDDPFTRHSYPSPAPAPLNAKVGVGSASTPAGPESIAGSVGMVVSTVQERVAAVPPFPASSR
jgi:hypothetical protein